jgi:CheY-like chemotaxis protein
MVHKVLLIDDEEGFTRLLKMNLERTGKFEVAVENHSQRALAAARVFRPDAIVLDVVMPGLDGGDLLALFADDPALRHVPVIMLTALVSREDTGPQAAVQTGSVIALPKPVDLPLLVRCLDDALANRPEGIS